MLLTKHLPVAALLAGATVWGLIWYPYRALQQYGVNGELATTLTYALSLAFGALLLRPRRRELRAPWLLIAIALSAGWCNIGFMLAVIHGDVMRVVLLFYLAPIWTVVLARLLLGERLSPLGYPLILLALAGAVVMVWNPQLGMPLPKSAAEWLGLSAGVMFALSNVLARKTTDRSIEIKTLSVFAGCVVVGAAWLLFAQWPSASALEAAADHALLLGLLACVVLSVNVAVQFALINIAANRAIVIYLFELVVTAVSAWLLAGEVMTLKEWLGGIMIVAAGLWSDRAAASAPPGRGQAAPAALPDPTPARAASLSCKIRPPQS